jgi:hypothetical protein
VNGGPLRFGRGLWTGCQLVAHVLVGGTVGRERAYLSLRLVLVLVDFCGMPIVSLIVNLKGKIGGLLR